MEGDNRKIKKKKVIVKREKMEPLVGVELTTSSLSEANAEKALTYTKDAL